MGVRTGTADELLRRLVGALHSRWEALPCHARPAVHKPLVDRLVPIARVPSARQRADLAEQAPDVVLYVFERVWAPRQGLIRQREFTQAG